MATPTPGATDTHIPGRNITESPTLQAINISASGALGCGNAKRRFVTRLKRFTPNGIYPVTKAPNALSPAIPIPKSAPPHGSM